MTAIGIDIGGTTSRAGLVEPSGQLVDRLDCPTPDGIEELDAFLARAVRKLGAAVGEPRPIVGVALPGIVNPASGIVQRSINLPGLEGRPIARDLESRIDCRAIAVTDADAATWGEYAARPEKPGRFAHLRLGTGVACGVVIAHRIQPMEAGRRGHLRVLVVDDGRQAATCACGRRGCLETVASGRAIHAHAADAGYTDGLPAIRTAWQRGERAAREIVSGVAIAISRALNNLTQLYCPQRVCLGGGVVATLPFLVTAVTETCGGAQGAMPSVPIEPARLGDDAGVVGAARLAMEAFGQTAQAGTVRLAR